MSYTVQQRDISILSQLERRVYVQVEVLNKHFKTVFRVDGQMIQDDYSQDAESDIRKTYNITMQVADPAVLVGRGKAVWLDKYIRLTVGIYDSVTDELLLYPQGIYCFSEAAYNFDAQTNQLTLSCVDRMGELTGERGGKISGPGTQIPAGSSIRSAMISTVTQLGSIEKYRIDDMDGNAVPYDLEYSCGSFVYDIISELRDLYPGWETFFDDDVFVCQKYPTYESDPVVMNADIISKLLISESPTYPFKEVFNVVEVWGKCGETENYSESVSVGAKSIQVDYGDTVTYIRNSECYGLKLDEDNPEAPNFGVSSAALLPLRRNGTDAISAGEMRTGEMIMVQCMLESDYYTKLASLVDGNLKLSCPGLFDILAPGATIGIKMPGDIPAYANLVLDEHSIPIMNGQNNIQSGVLSTGNTYTFKLSAAVDHYTEIASYSGATLNASYKNIAEMKTGEKYGFLSPSANPANMMFRAGTSEAFPVYSTSVLTLSGALSSRYAYVTIGENDYYDEKTFVVTPGRSIQVYVSGSTAAGRNQCYIKYNGTTVKTGAGSYVFAMSANTSIVFTSYTGYYVAEITTGGDSALPAGTIAAGKSYSLRFGGDKFYYLGEVSEADAQTITSCNLVNTGSSPDNYFSYLGGYQIAAIAKQVAQMPTDDEITLEKAVEPTSNISYVVRPDSPFCREYEIGEIRNVLCDGEYADIYSESLARERAEYELWKATDLKDTIVLNMIDVPWLEVNQKIEYKSPRTGETGIYLIKQKTGSSTGGTMTLTCVKFQPLYPWNE